MTAAGTRRILRPYAALFHTVIHGKIESPWKIIAFVGSSERGAAISSVPAVACSRPARMRRSVVFPHPLGPTIMKNSPDSMSTDTLSMAVSAPNVLRETANADSRQGRILRVAAARLLGRTVQDFALLPHRRMRRSLSELVQQGVCRPPCGAGTRAGSTRARAGPAAADGGRGTARNQAAGSMVV